MLSSKICILCPPSLFQLSLLLTGHALVPYLYSGYPQTEFNTHNFIVTLKGGVGGGGEGVLKAGPEE